MRLRLNRCMMLILLSCAFTAKADSIPVRYSVGVDLSAIRLAGGEKGSTVGPASAMHLSYYVHQQAFITYNLSYGRVKPRAGNSYFNADPAFDLQTLLLLQSIEFAYKLKPWRRITPFIGAGVGLLVWDICTPGEGGLFTKGLFPGSSLHDGPALNTTLSINSGVAVPLSDHFNIKLSLRFTHLFDQREDNIGTNDTNSTLLNAIIGLEYKFLGPRDTDGDGIWDRDDGDPLRAEDMDGFRDDDGIPDPDNDQDGVPDIVDKAPLKPEDIDGFEDEDGVPDPDNDWDGIPDVEDGAPNQPEDFDGYQDDDGVPDSDDDEDGIPDLIDRCKNEPETYNGYRDDDGCPDEKPEPITGKGERIILRDIQFELDSAELTRKSYTVLDVVYESLYANPEVEIEIRGYTDSTGHEAYNQNLSTARAKAVRNYLLQKGIAGYRIKAVGYGEKDPMAGNATEEGRAQNRRIEFFRLE